VAEAASIDNIRSHWPQPSEHRTFALSTVLPELKAAALFTCVSVVYQGLQESLQHCWWVWVIATAQSPWKISLSMKPFAPHRSIYLQSNYYVICYSNFLAENNVRSFVCFSAYKFSYFLGLKPQQLLGGKLNQNQDRCVTFHEFYGYTLLSPCIIS